MTPSKRFRWFKSKEATPVLQQWFSADIGETYPSNSQERGFRELPHSGGFWIDLPLVSEE